MKDDPVRAVIVTLLSSTHLTASLERDLDPRGLPSVNQNGTEQQAKRCPNLRGPTLRR